MLDEGTASELFTDSLKSDAEDLGGGVHRVLLGYDKHLMMAKVWFDADAVGAAHSHPHSQVSYVVDGRFEVTVDGRTQVLGPGECFRVPSNAEHGAVCLEAGVLIDVFSPVRNDFLSTAGEPS